MKIDIPRFFLKNNEIKEKDLLSKDIEELMLLKDEEHDFLSINIPILVAIWIALLPVKDLWNWWGILFYYLLWIIISFYIIEVNEISKKNMKVYNEVIGEKLKEQEKENDEYKKEILKYMEKLCTK